VIDSITDAANAAAIAGVDLREQRFRWSARAWGI
jgi:hypothetical protein